MAGPSKRMKMGEPQNLSRVAEAIRKLPQEVLRDSIAMLPLDDQVRLGLLSKDWSGIMDSVPVQMRPVLSLSLRTDSRGYSVSRQKIEWTEHHKTRSDGVMTRAEYQYEWGKMEFRRHLAYFGSINEQYPTRWSITPIRNGSNGFLTKALEQGYAPVHISSWVVRDEPNVRNELWEAMGTRRKWISMEHLYLQKEFTLMSESQALSLFKRYGGSVVHASDIRHLRVLATNGPFNVQLMDLASDNQRGIVHHMLHQKEGSSLMISGQTMDSDAEWRKFLTEMLDAFAEGLSKHEHAHVDAFFWGPTQTNDASQSLPEIMPTARLIDADAELDKVTKNELKKYDKIGEMLGNNGVCEMYAVGRVVIWIDQPKAHAYVTRAKE